MDGAVADDKRRRVPRKNCFSDGETTAARGASLRRRLWQAVVELFTRAAGC